MRLVLRETMWKIELSITNWSKCKNVLMEFERLECLEWSPCLMNGLLDSSKHLLCFDTLNLLQLSLLFLEGLLCCYGWCCWLHFGVSLASFDFPFLSTSHWHCAKASSICSFWFFSPYITNLSTFLIKRARLILYHIHRYLHLESFFSWELYMPWESPIFEYDMKHKEQTLVEQKRKRKRKRKRVLENNTSWSEKNLKLCNNEWENLDEAWKEKKHA